MTLWWLQPGWDQATCGNCGTRIAPEGDPDWGLCFPCMEQSLTAPSTHIESGIRDSIKEGNASREFSK